MSFALAVLDTGRGRLQERVAATLIVILCLATIATGSIAGPGGDGHSHGDEARPVATAASPRVAMTGDVYEAVAIFKNGTLKFYVDRLANNAPVVDGTLSVTINANEVTAEAAPDGTYIVNGASLAPGNAYELIVSVQASDGEDLLAGTLDIAGAAHSPEAHSHALDRARALLQSNPVLASSIIFGVALVLGLAAGASTTRARRTAAVLVGALLLASMSPSAAGPGGDGHTHGNEGAAPAASDAPQRLPDGSVFLPKPTQRLTEVRTQRAEESVVRRTVSIPGRIIANPQRSGVVQSINGGRLSVANGKLPALGQLVKKGDLLAIIEPPVNAADETTIADRAGEIRQQISIAETRLQRLAPLAKSNVVPRTQVADLETDLDSLRARLGNIGTQRRQAEELRAPIDGEVAQVRVVAGQMVTPQDQLFQIIDPSALWVEAFGFSGLNPADIESAVATGHSAASAKLRFEGAGRVLQQHMVPMHFSIEEPPSRLMIGEPVTVLAQTKAEVKGIILPRAAVVRASNGELIVWNQVAAERFARAPVRIEPLDGARVAVIAGLEPGQRIVVSGAELINQIR